MENSFIFAHPGSVTDFHRGWLIEVFKETVGYRATCYSPSRRCLAHLAPYVSNAQAMSAARKCIDNHCAVALLLTFLRDQYEVSRLSFDEWQKLGQSITALDLNL